MVRVSDAWFRSPAWDDSARQDFERRLDRARAQNRPQYLRVKAIALRDAGHLDAARQLLLRVLDHSDVYAHEVASANELLGELAARRGDDDEAARYYRRILVDQPSLSGTSGAVEMALAELLIDRAADTDRAEALELLESWLARPGLKFDNELFRWHLARIRLAEQAGDGETVRHVANAALQLAGRGPQLSRHKDVGLVAADPATLAWLRTLAG